MATAEVVASARFPLRVQHHLHEPAHSLLLRTAAHNGTYMFSTVYKRLGVDLGRSIHTIDPAVIAAKCGADADAVYDATAKVDGWEITLLGQTFSKDHWSGWFRRWCPICLKEAPYHRAWWDLSVITTCTKHGVELVSHCPCEKPLQTGLQPIIWCRKKHDLSAVDTTPVDPAELAAERYIMARLTSPQDAPTIEVLEGVTLGAAISVMEWLGKFRLSKGKSLFALRKDPGQRKLIRAGFSILSDFPQAYDTLLDDMVAGRTGKPLTGKKWGIEHAYGYLNRFLVDRIRENPGDALAQRLKDRLDDHAKANVLLKSGFLASGKPVLGTPLKDVATRCGMGFEVFVRIAEKLDLISVHRTRGMPHRITQEQADSIVERINSYLTMEQVSELMGVASERVIDLVEDGLITCVDRPYDRRSPTGKRGDTKTKRLRDRPSNKWLFEPDVVPAFLARLEKLAVVVNRESYADLMPLSSAGILYTQVLRAVQLMLEGKLFIRGFDDTAAGLTRLLVSRSEAAEAFKLDRRDGNWALRDAAPLMGMNYNQLRGCVKCGLVVPLGWGKAIYLTDDLIEEFNRTYVRASDLSESFKWSGGSKVVIRHMREAGVEPVSGKQDLGVTLYRRYEVEPVAARLPAPTVFTSTRERAAYQKAKGLQMTITTRAKGKNAGGIAGTIFQSR